VLALIVDDPAPVPFVVALGELERIEVVDPAPFHAEHRVAMAVAEDGHERRILDALGDQERPLRALDLDDLAGEPQALELGRHELSHIVVELLSARRILALGRKCDTAREHLLERARIEGFTGIGDGGVARHEGTPVASVRSIAKPGIQRRIGALA